MSCCCDDDEEEDGGIVTQPVDSSGPWNLRKMSNDPTTPILLWKQSLSSLSDVAGGSGVYGVACNGTSIAAASGTQGTAATGTLNLLDGDGNIQVQSLFASTYRPTLFVEYPSDIYLIGVRALPSVAYLIHQFDTDGTLLDTAAVGEVGDWHITDGVYYTSGTGGFGTVTKLNLDLTAAWGAVILGGGYAAVSLREISGTLYVVGRLNLGISGFDYRLFQINSATGADLGSIAWSGAGTAPVTRPTFLCKGNTADLIGSNDTEIQRVTTAGVNVWSYTAWAPRPISNDAGKVWWQDLNSLDASGNLRYSSGSGIDTLCIAVDSEESVLLGSEPRFF